ncbi:MAG TPA: helix-turn-helix transcriptional regulator [Candidatus Angelobacter sp.]|nr:helix-turn-helix transcriptional regulator [Candidatus Angelobacter sp.]
MGKSKKGSTSKVVTTDIEKRPMRPIRTEPAEENNIRNWRLYRKIATQEDLAELTKKHDPKKKGLDRITILRLENGETRYHAGHLEILSRALQAAPGDLIRLNPFNTDDPAVVLAGLPPEDQARAKIVVPPKAPKRR